MEKILVAAALAYAAYHFTQQNKQGNNTAPDKNIFPLKVGGNNIFVKNMQNAILNKGGLAAELILKSGGANGVFSANVASALRVLGYTAELSEKDYRQLIDNIVIVRNYAYVGNQNGTKLYSSTESNYLPGYGTGRDEITGIPYRAYLGTATGYFENDMLEITTTINTQKIKFWVSTKDIKLVSKEEYETLKNSTILEKTDKVKQELLKVS